MLLRLQPAQQGAALFRRAQAGERHARARRVPHRVGQERVEPRAGPGLAACAAFEHRGRVGKARSAGDAAADHARQRRADAVAARERVAERAQRKDALPGGEHLVALGRRRGLALGRMARDHEPAAQLDAAPHLVLVEFAAQLQECLRLSPGHARLGEPLGGPGVASLLAIDGAADEALFQRPIHPRSRREERREVRLVLLRHGVQGVALRRRQDGLDGLGDAVARHAMAALDAQVDEAEVLAGLACRVVVVVRRRARHPGHEAGAQVPQFLAAAAAQVVDASAQPGAHGLRELVVAQLAGGSLAAQRSELLALSRRQARHDLCKALGVREAELGLGDAEAFAELAHFVLGRLGADEQAFEPAVDRLTRLAAAFEGGPLRVEQLRHAIALRLVEQFPASLADGPAAQHVAAGDAKAHEAEVVGEAADRHVVVFLGPAREPGQCPRDDRVRLLLRRQLELAFEAQILGRGEACEQGESARESDLWHRVGGRGLGADREGGHERGILVLPTGPCSRPPCLRTCPGCERRHAARGIGPGVSSRRLPVAAEFHDGDCGIALLRFVTRTRVTGPS